MKRYLRASLVFLLTAAAGVVLLELFFRSAEVSLPSFVQNDDFFGRTLKPHSSIIAFNEGFYLGSVNDHGYLGIAYPPERRGGTRRIALLGDSYVEGFQLFDRDHFGRRMERRLNEASNGPRYEVLNFGLSGLDFPGIVLRFEHQVAGFRPDVTILVVGATDFTERDNNFTPRYLLSGDSLSLSFPFRNDAKYRFNIELASVRSLASFTLLNAGFNIYRSGAVPRIVFDKLYYPSWNAASQNAKSPEANEGITELMPETDALFRHISRSPLWKNGRFIVVSRDKLPDHIDTLLSTTPSLTYVRMHEHLDSLRQQGIDPNYWTATRMRGHWNPDTHVFISQFLAEIVRSLP